MKVDWSDKEQVAAYNKAWKAAHPERVRSYRENPQSHYKARREWDKRNREKYLAHRALAYLVKHNKITKPDACEKCGTKGRVEGHHADYNKPLDVEFLCRACHMKQHQRGNE